MLVWTECPEGWTSDGFRIVLEQPFRWLLLDEPNSEVTRERSAISLPQEPLAVTRTLAGAKREAELVASTRARATMRRRQTLILLVAIGVASLLLGAPIAGSELPLLVAGAVAVRSLAILLGTLVPSVFGDRHEIFYQ